MSRKAAVSIALANALALAGCGNAAPEEDGRPPADPALAAALNEQMMVDPDLALMNPRNAAVLVPGPSSAPIPPEDTSPETVAVARAEATRLSGGRVLRAPAPAPGVAPGAGRPSWPMSAAATC